MSTTSIIIGHTPDEPAPRVYIADHSTQIVHGDITHLFRAESWTPAEVADWFRRIADRVEDAEARRLLAADAQVAS